MRLALHLLGLSILTQALQRLRPFHYKTIDYSSKNQHVLHSTRYTIEYTSKNAERHVLPSIILKHHRTADLYKSRFLPSPHNIEAVSAALEFINSSNASSGKPRPIILDSGCGTGKSTILLAKTFPSHSVIGIDRSLPRLSKSLDLPTPPPNLLFLRADLHDFYVLLASSSSPPPQISKHFILYPNPYPKLRRLKQRLYAHPSFPFLLRLSKGGGGEITVRSNFEFYLESFRDSVDALALALSLPGGEASITASSSMQMQLQLPAVTTNFEKKYLASNETCYELVLNV